MKRLETFAGNANSSISIEDCQTIEADPPIKNQAGFTSEGGRGETEKGKSEKALEEIREAFTQPRTQEAIGGTSSLISNNEPSKESPAKHRIKIDPDIGRLFEEDEKDHLFEVHDETW